jgi:hypothetical protein
MFGLPLKVVSEVDEMGLFHQLGYENGGRRLQQSTASSERSSTEVFGKAGQDPSREKESRRERTSATILAVVQVQYSPLC